MIAESTWTMVGNGLLGLGANGSLLLGSYWIARHGFKQPRGLSAALATAVIFLGREHGRSRGAGKLRGAGARSHAGLGSDGRCGWVALFGGFGPKSSPDPRQLEPRALSWDAVLSLALLLSAALVLGMKSLILGVKVVSDGPIYHLYFAARWWKAGRLFLVASPFGENAATYFPANGDLWFTWLMATWGGDRLAKVGQAPFLVLAALAAYGCARRLGAGRSASVVATCWFASSTPLLIFSFEPNVDTIFVAGYLMAAYFFLRASEGAGDTAAYCLGALAAGEASGPRPSGLSLFLRSSLWRWWRYWSRPCRLEPRSCGLLVILLGPARFRRLLVYSQRLSDRKSSLSARGQTAGPKRVARLVSSRGDDNEPVLLAFRRLAGAGRYLAAVLDPRLAPFWIAALVAGPGDHGPRTTAATAEDRDLLVMAVLNVVLYWVCIPYRTQQRFMLQALGLAVVPLAITLDRSRWLRCGGRPAARVAFAHPARLAVSAC